MERFRQVIFNSLKGFISIFEKIAASGTQQITNYHIIS